MLDTARAQRKYIREVVRIGQVWQHHGPEGPEGPEYSIQIKQIHRADRAVEAWFERPEGRKSRAVPFADLARAYELVEEPDRAGP
jgi:hypothetical protein